MKENENKLGKTKRQEITTMDERSSD